MAAESALANQKETPYYSIRNVSNSKKSEKRATIHTTIFNDSHTRSVISCFNKKET